MISRERRLIWEKQKIILRTNGLKKEKMDFFYTMKRLSLKDTQEINAGATYSAKCNYCGKIFKATYWPFLISKASAKVACEGKLHNHIINSHYGNL